MASFADLSIDKAGTGYTLSATSGVLPAATSAAFDIAAGAATKLVFSVQPSASGAGVVISPAVQVSAQDALGNTDPTFTGNVTEAIGTNPGSGTLSGSSTLAAVAGVATFTNLSIDKVGTGYTLTAGSGSLTGGISASVHILPGPPASLQFSVQPTSTTAGATISPAVQVTARDGLGNVATDFQSAALHQAALRSFAVKGATHFARAAVTFRPYIERAEGARKWDVDGHEYLDYVMGHGALILGHSHPAVVEAVRAQMGRGVHFGDNHPLEVEWAGLIQEMMPSDDRVEYFASGQEANLMAIRLARVQARQA